MLRMSESYIVFQRKLLQALALMVGHVQINLSRVGHGIQALDFFKIKFNFFLTKLCGRQTAYDGSYGQKEYEHQI